MDQVENAQETTEAVESSAPSSDTAPSSHESSVENFLDLDKYEKPFKFQGKEWTAKDFMEHHIPKSVFTKKSQEVAQERKFQENVEFDLDKLEDNPDLLEEFKKIYPEKFHARAERVVNRILGGKQGQSPDKAQGQPVDRGLEQRLNKMEKYFAQVEQKERETRVQSHVQELSKIADEFTKKYPLADETVALSKAQALIDKAANEGDDSFKMDKAQWDRIYKSIHEANQKRYEQHYSKQFNDVKNANRQAKDMGHGGGTPGQAPREVRTIREAGVLARRDLAGE